MIKFGCFTAVYLTHSKAIILNWSFYRTNGITNITMICNYEIFFPFSWEVRRPPLSQAGQISKNLALLNFILSTICVKIHDKLYEYTQPLNTIVKYVTH